MSKNSPSKSPESEHEPTQGGVQEVPDDAGLSRAEIDPTRDSAASNKEPCYKVDYERIIPGGTLLVLFLTFLAALYAGYEAKRLADLTQTAISDTQYANQIANTSARAAIMQATQNRARLWVQVADRPDLIEEQSPYVRVKLKFSITNYGQSPAIITGSLFHLFWTMDEPDPTQDIQTSQIHQTAVWPPDMGAEIRDLGRLQYKTIPANTGYEIHKDFISCPRETTTR